MVGLPSRPGHLFLSGSPGWRLTQLEKASHLRRQSLPSIPQPGSLPSEGGPCSKGLPTFSTCCKVKWSLVQLLGTRRTTIGDCATAWLPTQKYPAARKHPRSRGTRGTGLRSQTLRPPTPPPGKGARKIKAQLESRYRGSSKVPNPHSWRWTSTSSSKLQLQVEISSPIPPPSRFLPGGGGGREGGMVSNTLTWSLRSQLTIRNPTKRVGGRRRVGFYQAGRLNSPH